MIKKLNHLRMQSYGQTLSAQVTPSSFSTTNMTKIMTIFLGQVKGFTSLWQLPEDVLRVSKWDEYEYINEVGPGHAIYSRKSSLLNAGGFAEESGVVLAWALPGRSCGRYASRRESGSIRQLSLQSKFLPSFRERCSPPNPESASIGRNLGWRNYTEIPVSGTKGLVFMEVSGVTCLWR